MNHLLSQNLQEGILDILESSKKEELVKGSKIKQARVVVSLRKKYAEKRKKFVV